MTGTSQACHQPQANSPVTGTSHPLTILNQKIHLTPTDRTKGYGEIYDEHMNLWRFGDLKVYTYNLWWFTGL